MNQFEIAKYQHVIRSVARNREGFWVARCETAVHGKWESWARRRSVAVQRALSVPRDYDRDRVPAGEVG